MENIKNSEKIKTNWIVFEGINKKGEIIPHNAKKHNNNVDCIKMR